MATRETKKLLEQIKQLRKEEDKFIKMNLKSERDYTHAIESRRATIRKLANDLKEANISQQKQYAEIEKSIGSISDSFEGFKNAQTKSLSSLIQSDNLTKDQKDQVENLLSLSRDIAELNAEDTEQIASKVQQYDKALSDLGEEVTLSKDLLNNLDSQFKQSKNIAALSETEKNILEKQTNATKEVKETFQGISETVQTILIQLRSVTGVLGFAFIAAGKFAGKLAEANKELGQVGSGLTGASGQASLLGFIFDNSVSSLQSLGKEFGDIENASLAVQASTNVIASNFGVSESEAAKLQFQLSNLNGDSIDVANNLVKATQEFAQQNGIIPSQLMGDLAANAEQFALFGKQGGKNIIEAAGFAAKLGVSMSEIAGIAEGLLDFENSITKELELSALLGKNINLNKARELAFNNDIQGATEETLRQIGGIAEFNRMNFYQRKATADLLGVSVEQLQKMVKNQGKANNMSALGSAEFSTQNEILNNILANQMPGILTAFGGFLGLLAIANKRTTLLGGLFSKMGGGIKGLGQKLGLVSGPAGPLTKSGMPDMRFKANKMAPSLPSTGPATQGTGGLTGMISKINPGKLLAGAGALVIVAGALFVFGKAVQQFMEVSWGAVGMAVVSMLSLVGALALLGTIMSSGVGALAILAGAAAMVIVAGAMFILGKAIQEVAIGFNMLGGFMEGLTTMIAMAGMLTVFTLSMFGLAGALYVLGAALAYLAFAGLPGLLMLAGIAAISGTIIKLASILGVGGTSETGAVEEGGESLDAKMLTELEMIHSTLKRGHVIKMDGTVVGRTVFGNEDNNLKQAAVIQ
tara:strand:- start:2492 stop:4930 length:2439 start_codon:yes stop_codon:yes gene_type:complete